MSLKCGSCLMLKSGFKENFERQNERNFDD